MDDTQILLLFAQAIILVVQIYLYKSELKTLDKKLEQLIELNLANSLEGESISERGKYTSI